MLIFNPCSLLTFNKVFKYNYIDQFITIKSFFCVLLATNSLKKKIHSFAKLSLVDTWF